MDAGDLGGGRDVAEQPVLAECGDERPSLSNGNTLTLNVTVTFQPAFSGAKNIYLYAVDVSGSNSGWQQRGAWTVTEPAGTPSAVSVTPSSGSGASQSFASNIPIPRERRA